MLGGGFKLMRGRGFARKRTLMIFPNSAIPSAFVSFRIVRPTRSRFPVKPSPSAERNYLLRHGRCICAKRAISIAIYLILRQCQLHPASALVLFVSVSPLIHPRGGGWVICRGLGAIFAQNATSSAICPFCASASFRQIPSVSVRFAGFLPTRIGPPAVKPPIWRGEVFTGARVGYLRRQRNF